MSKETIIYHLTSKELETICLQAISYYTINKKWKQSWFSNRLKQLNKTKYKTKILNKRIKKELKK